MASSSIFQIAPGAWTPIGPGPIEASAVQGEVWIASGPAQPGPSAVGHVLAFGQRRRFRDRAIFWATTPNPGGAAVISSPIVPRGGAASPPPPPSPSADVYASPSGDDANPGTLAAPVRTLAGVRTRLREKIAENPARNLKALLLGGGTYRLSAPLVLTHLDKVADGYTTTWQGPPGQRPVISGGVTLTGFTDNGSTWTGNLSTDPATAALWAAGWRCTEIFVNGAPAEWPCWPPKGTARNVTVADATSSWVPSVTDTIVPTDYGDAASMDGWAASGRACNVFTVADATVVDPAWTNLQDVRLRVNCPGNWFDSSIPIQSAVASGGNIVVTLKAHAQTAGGFPLGTPVRAENVSKGVAGDCYINRSTGVVTYWPRAGETLESAEIVAPVLDEFILISMAGREGGNGVTEVGNVEFTGLTFKHSRSPTENRGWVGGAQDMFTAPWSIIRLVGAHDVDIHHCTFDLIGEGIVEGGPGSYNNKFRSNDCRNIGFGGAINTAAVARNLVRYPDQGTGLPDYLRGVWGAGLMPDAYKSKQDGFIFVDNDFFNFGRKFKNCGAYVSRELRNVTASNNRLRNFPSWGLCFYGNMGGVSSNPSQGRWTVENNYAERGNSERGAPGQAKSADCAWVYLSGARDATFEDGKAARVRRNVSRDMYPSAAPDNMGVVGGEGAIYWASAYLDDLSSNTDYGENVFVGVASNLLTYKGQDNYIHDNIFVLDVRGRKFAFADQAAKTYCPYAITPTPQAGHIFANVQRNVLIIRSDEVSIPPGLPPQGIILNFLSQITPYTSAGQFLTDYNLIFQTGGANAPYAMIDATFAQWRAATGQDTHTILQQDPLFTDPDNLDFSFPPSSPLHDIGFAGFPITAGLLTTR